MSNRFYVNGVQIFGNNEMFKNTYDELKKQGAEWTEDGTFDTIEIKDPQALMEAVEKDSLLYLKDRLTKDVWSERKNKFINRQFSKITDKHLLENENFKKDFILCLYNRKGEVHKHTWRRLMWWIDGKRAFTSLTLYLAIQNDVEFRDGKLELKKDGKITACMY